MVSVILKGTIQIIAFDPTFYQSPLIQTCLKYFLLLILFALNSTCFFTCHFSFESWKKAAGSVLLNLQHLLSPLNASVVKVFMPNLVRIFCALF